MPERLLGYLMTVLLLRVVVKYFKVGQNFTTLRAEYGIIAYWRLFE